MPFANMAFSLVGEVPGMEMPLAQSKINEALGHVYDSLIWSFQFKEDGWFTPGLQFGSPTATASSGTITATRFSNQVVGDATAAALWVAYQNAGTMPLLTQYQLRCPRYSLYNIIAFDGVNTFTLDRVWMDPDGAGLQYMVYQAYFPVPVSDFKRFLEIRDTTNAAPIDFWSLSRVDLSLRDPQRTVYNQPGYCVPYEADSRAGSATLGNMLYELWGHPLSELPYTFSYLRRGSLLSLPTDTLPYPLTEELVMWRAKEVSYQWKEAQKGDGLARGSGANWLLLADMASKRFVRELKVIADRDRDMVQTYFNRFFRGAALGYWGQPFATINGDLNVGR